MRLTTTEAGLLDATPVERGKLVDFVLLGASLARAIELAESFWITNRGELRNAQRFIAAVHALFLAPYPQSLQFEELIHLYMAIDARYRLANSLRPLRKKHDHADRIAWVCDEFGSETPEWATQSAGGGVEVAAIRNYALHEALFMDTPLGFAVHRDGNGGNLTLEMSALVGRLLVALIGGNDDSYLGSPVNARQRHGLRLS